MTVGGSKSELIPMYFRLHSMQESSICLVSA